MFNFKNNTWQKFNKSSKCIFGVVLTLSSFGMHAAGLKGDVAPRGAPDGILDAADIFQVVNFISGQATPTIQEQHIADVAPLGNADGILDFDDVTLLYQALDGSINIDTIPPDPLSLNHTTINYKEIGSFYSFATIDIEDGSLEPLSEVVITNQQTGDPAISTASALGGLSISLIANDGDQLSIVLRDTVGNIGDPSFVKVLRDPSEPGPYKVGWVNIDHTNGIPNLRDPNAKLGPDRDVTLAWAKAMYPAEQETEEAPVDNSLGQLPVVLFIHGNGVNCDDDGAGTGTTGVIAHPCAGDPSMNIASDQQRIPSHEGFEYLMRGLASHGIFAISISAHQLQSFGSEEWTIPARGRLVLAFLDKLKDWTDNGTDPFNGILNGRLDMNKIGLSGHSRGGYGVIAAQQLNKARLSPHSIMAVNTIAPAPIPSTEDQYVITETPYFLILGARDGDAGNNAFGSYDGAHTDGNSAIHPKMAIHVFGANHNYFNEILTDADETTVISNPWAGASDDGAGFKSDFVMAAQDQRRIALTTITAFFRWHLQGHNDYREVFTGNHQFPALPNSQLHWSFQDAGRKVVENYEGTPPAVQDGFTRFEQCSPLWNHSLPFSSSCFGSWNQDNFGHIAHTTGGLALAWDNSQTYAIDIPVSSSDVSMYTYLTFRVAKRANDVLPVSGGDPINLFINIEDMDGDTAVWDLRTDQYASIPHPFQRNGFFPETFLIAPGNRSQLSSIRIPLEHFTTYGSNVDLNQITRIIVKTEGAGEAVVDDIEFSN